ncbi:MAG TPA: hypothetical protein VGJ07_23910, partial [Rugosimonospora sp.]
MAGSSVVYRSRRRRRRRRLRRALLAVTIAVCVLSLGAGWLVLRGWEAHGHLASAAGLAGDLSEQVLAGETTQARRTLAALQ